MDAPSSLQAVNQIAQALLQTVGQSPNPYPPVLQLMRWGLDQGLYLPDPSDPATFQDKRLRPHAFQMLEEAETLEDPALAHLLFDNLSVPRADRAPEESALSPQDLKGLDPLEAASLLLGQLLEQTFPLWTSTVTGE